MARYRCSRCGLGAMSAPGANIADMNCRYCGGNLTPVAAPPAPSFQSRSPFSSSALWIVLAIGASITLFLGLRFAADPGELEVVMASQRTVPADQFQGPIRAQSVAVRRGRQVLFTLSMTDAQGGVIRSVRAAGGARPPAPTITVHDANGRQVYVARMEYG